MSADAPIAGGQPGPGEREAQPSADRHDLARRLRANIAVVLDLIDGRGRAARARLERSEPTGRELVAFLENHRLGWFLAEHADAPALEGLLPAEEVERLVQLAATRRVRRERTEAEIRRVLPGLASRGIDAILLKGPTLAARHPRIARRLFLDFDVLVPAHQAEATERVLAALGYRRLSRPLVSPALSRRFTHGFDFGRGELRLDLHWSLASHPSYRIDAGRFRGRCRAVRFADGFETRALGDGDELFALLLSLFEDLDRDGARLRSFVDLDGVLADLDATLDWDGFWRERARERTRRPCAHVLGLFLLLFDGAERFPRATRSLAGVAPDARPTWDEAAALLDRSSGRWFNKRWAMQRYECAAWQHAAWWLVSLPFRLSVYDPDRRGRRGRRRPVRPGIAT